MNALAREAALLPLPGTLDLKVREGGRVEALWEFWDAYAVRLPKEAFTREGQRLLREFSDLAALPWDLLGPRLEVHFDFIAQELGDRGDEEEAEVLAEFSRKPTREALPRVREVLKGLEIRPELADLLLLSYEEGEEGPAPPLSPKAARLVARAEEAGRSLRALSVEWRLPLFVFFPKDWLLEDAAIEALNDHVFTPAYEAGEAGGFEASVGGEEEARALARGLRSLLGGLAALVREWGGKEALEELWAGLEAPERWEEPRVDLELDLPAGWFLPPPPSFHRGPGRDGGAGGLPLLTFLD